MTEHKTRRVAWCDQEAEIDEGIADLIEEIWKAGIYTDNCCEDNVPAGWVWIEFSSVDNAETFLQIVAGKYSPEYGSLYQRIFDPGDPRYRIAHKRWRYDALPWDCHVRTDIVNDEVVESPTGRPFMMFSLSVRFPRTDLKTVLGRMINWNRAKDSKKDTLLCLRVAS